MTSRNGIIQVCKLQEFMIGGGGAAVPPVGGMEEVSDDDDPRGGGHCPPAAKAKATAIAVPSKATATSSTALVIAAPAKAAETAVQAKAKALGPPPTPPAKAFVAPPPVLEEENFLIGGPGVGGSSASSSKAKAAAKGKAKPKAKPKAKRKERIPVPAIGAGEVYFDEYKSPMRLEPYGNWTFYCPRRPGCPPDCQRTMGVVPRNMKLLKSDLQPLAFLHAWRDCAIDPKKGHRLSPVPDADVRSFFENHEDELTALRDLCAPP